MKKTIAFTLSLLMLLSLLPLSAAAKTVQSGTCGIKDSEKGLDGSQIT